jgi:hypothetical protein
MASFIGALPFSVTSLMPFMRRSNPGWRAQEKFLCIPVAPVLPIRLPPSKRGIQSNALREWMVGSSDLHSLEACTRTCNMLKQVVI